VTAPYGRVGAVVAAAGSSARMAGADKLFAAVAGRPLLAHVLAALEATRYVDAIALVLSAANLERGRELAAEQGLSKVTAVCEGGARRQDSVRRGLEALGDCDWMLVQDGSRLLVEPVIDEGLEAARGTGAAVPAVPIADTVKQAEAGGPIEQTLDRRRLWAAQTPQVFRHDLLTRAHREVRIDVTDDAAMLEALGLPVALFPGSPLNLKVTTSEDLRLAEVLLQRAASAAGR
jgi:2-C-methyl-D-erythritol 4-phosphate cytidylyltransferase